MTTWFTADWHLDHHNIIKYCKRPFKSVTEMNQTILNNYCAAVKPHDVVFFVGDLSMHKGDYKQWYDKTFSKLPGIKYLILGNHDKLKPFTYVSIGFVSVHTSLKVDEFFIVHNPATVITKDYKKIICGHIHNLFKKQGNCLNVGVDVWDFKPINIKQVRTAFE